MAKLGDFLKGLRLTANHWFRSSKGKNEGIHRSNYFEQQGSITIQYPKEKIPVPEVGRYQLDVEMDDCIVCDLCAKICPVNCIEIESIKATEDIGKTSDGTTKRLHAEKFLIDMAKCMYCGLCTVVCPTECIIMTDTYDKSVPRLSDLNYKFAEMEPAVAQEKKDMLAQVQAEREAAKRAALNPPKPTE